MDYLVIDGTEVFLYGDRDAWMISDSLCTSKTL